MSSEQTAEERTRKVIDRCSGCGHCRELMEDSSCLFMPELYRLVDRETTGGGSISSAEMLKLISLCNACGICPCTPVQTWINEARDAFIERNGVPAGVRLLEDVQLIGQIGSIFPRLANALGGDSLMAKGARRVVRIHPERKLPRFPQDSFTAWAKARGLHRKQKNADRKVAYFTGCTARYFFPEVAKASVEILQHHGVSVYLPVQKCCGMPPLLEGDRSFTLDRAHSNVEELARCVEEGYDIVCSCPTCGYLLKSVLREGAEYSEDYRSRVEQLAREAGGDMARVSEQLAQQDTAFTGRATQRSAHGRQPWLLGMVPWKIFNDQGYFSTISGLKRLRVSNHTYDLGEYLRTMLSSGELETGLAPNDTQVSYFAPCHQRQQGIGHPWKELLGMIPGLSVKSIGDGFDCCGQGGLMGFKQDFHDTSLRIGARLLDKIRLDPPQLLVTDCLSCRIQFQQAFPVKVIHPVELLRESYRDSGLSTAEEVVETPSQHREPA